MQIPLSKLAALINAELVGDSNILIEKTAPLHTADHLSVTFAEKPEKLDWATVTKARAVVLSKTANVQIPDNIAQLRVDNVKAAFDILARLFHPSCELLKREISAQAYLGENVTLGKNVAVGPFAVVSDNVTLDDDVTIFPGVVLLPGVVVGKGTTIYPNAVVYENCCIGANCILHAGVVLGSYGFGYDSSSGEHILAAQYGSVVLEDNVELGACATVDRGAYDATYVGEGTKIDNHVMLAHNCKVGKRNMICASCGIAGSVVTGDYVVMAGRVGVRDHISIGDGAVIGAMAGVMASVPAKARIVGIPATPEMEQMRKQAALTKLPDTLREVRSINKEIAKLQARLAALEAAQNDQE